MSDKRQKNQLELAFEQEYRGEAPKGLSEGTESLAVKRGTESLAIGEQLMEEVCERENCKQALARVKANKGSAGVDGMTVHELPEFLKQHWPAIREQLLSGTYKPQPVKRVEIPKPDGGVRKLGIPSVRLGSTKFAKLRQRGGKGPCRSNGRQRPRPMADRRLAGPSHRAAQCLLRFTRDSEIDCAAHCLTNRTAGCGPACPVVWEEGSRKASSYPDPV